MKTHSELRFVYRLARELGMTVGRLLHEMDSEELSSWIAFFSLEVEEIERKKQQETKQELSNKIKNSLMMWSLQTQHAKAR